MLLLHRLRLSCDVALARERQSERKDESITEVEAKRASYNLLPKSNKRLEISSLKYKIVLNFLVSQLKLVCVYTYKIKVNHESDVVSYYYKKTYKFKE